MAIERFRIDIHYVPRTCDVERYELVVTHDDGGKSHEVVSQLTFDAFDHIGDAYAALEADLETTGQARDDAMELYQRARTERDAFERDYTAVGERNKELHEMYMVLAAERDALRDLLRRAWEAGLRVDLHEEVARHLAQTDTRS